MTNLLIDTGKRRLIVLLLLAGWIGSLLLPAITLNNDPAAGPQVLSGAFVLCWGWIHLIIPQFGWLANPALWLVLILLARSSPGRIALRVGGVLLLITALHTVDLLLRPDYYQFEGAHPGYWLWMAVNLAAALTAIFLSLHTPAKGPA